MATGLDLLAVARPHLGENYVLGAVAPKNNPNWRGPWDCAEFASWCVFQVSGRLYGCNRNDIDPARADAYTGFWQRDAERSGRKVALRVAAQTPGAALLRVPRGSVIGHIAFSDGRGGTIEAKSRRAGVVRDTVNDRRWDFGILVPWIDYAPNLAPVDLFPPRAVYRLTTPHQRGEPVRRIQLALRDRGFDPGPADGIYGLQTLAAVQAFQVTAGLVPDGEVGRETARAMGVLLH